MNLFFTSLLFLVGWLSYPMLNCEFRNWSSVQKPVHRHRSRTDMLAEIAREVTLKAVHPPADGTKENLCKSSDRRFIAYTISEGTDRLFVNDTRLHVVYEVVGLPLAYRPLSDLQWITTARLAFDRWSQPHYGVHYELDMGRKHLVAAYGFPG